MPSTCSSGMAGRNGMMFQRIRECRQSFRGRRRSDRILSFMFDRKSWQSLITFGLLKSRAAREFVPACRVYLRPGGIWVFPQNTRGSGGGIGVTVGPAEAIGHDATEQALGEAVIAAISRSRFEPWITGASYRIRWRRAPTRATFQCRLGTRPVGLRSELPAARKWPSF